MWAIAEVRLRICVCCLLGVMPGFILSRLSPLYVLHSLSALCRVPCALFAPLVTQPVTSLCRLPSPMAAGLSTVSDRQRRCCHVVQREQITFRFPFSTCHLPLAARHHTVLPLLLATCHRGPSGAVGVHYASVFPHSNRSKSAPENVLRHRNNFY